VERHLSSVISAAEQRYVILHCTCGWQKNLRLEAGVDSTYADANAWASHFDFESRTSPFL
jgi:hypothetical protein